MPELMGPRPVRAIERMGDIMIPGDAGWPKFSSTHPSSRLNRLLETMPSGDLADLRLLLTILSFFPGFALRAFLGFLELSPKVPNGLGGGLLRMIRLGLRGVVMSLYYSAEDPIQITGYSASVYLEDLKD